MADSGIGAQVSVVLVNYESGAFGARAAASVRRQRGCVVELIVVDNASSDGSLQTIEDAASPDRVIRNPVNLGYAAAVNAGVRAASAAVVVPMNCDAELGDGYLERVLAVFATHIDVAVVGGVVRHGDGSTRGPQELTISMRVGELAADSEPGPYARVDASCPGWRRAAVEQVAEVFGTGPLDERFFVYGENVDLACKLAVLGWRSWFDPELRAAHERSLSSADRLADKRGELRSRVMESRWVNVVRHVPGSRVAFGLGWCAAEDLGFVVMRLARGDVRVVADAVRAWTGSAGSARRDWAVRRTCAELGSFREHGSCGSSSGIRFVIGRPRRIG